MLTIINAKVEDINTIKMLMEASFKEQLALGITVAKEEKGKIKNDILCNNVLLALINDSPVGTIRWGIYEKKNKLKIGWLKRLGVLPECRGRGIGAELVDKAEHLILKTGTKLIGLTTADTVDYLDDFYKKLGYRIKDRQRYAGYSFGLKFWKKSF